VALENVQVRNGITTFAALHQRVKAHGTFGALAEWGGGDVKRAIDATSLVEAPIMGHDVAQHDVAPASRWSRELRCAASSAPESLPERAST